MIKVNWEYTDTFGGEANYAWCKRGTFPAHDDASDRRIVCAAKLAAGLNGCRCKRETLGGGGYQTHTLRFLYCSFYLF